LSGYGHSGEADPTRGRWQGHNSDLPASWPLKRRRAFNKRANEIAHYYSEASHLVRSALLDEVEEFLARPGRYPSDDELESFLAGLKFEDLFLSRRAERMRAASEARGQRGLSLVSR